MISTVIILFVLVLVIVGLSAFKKRVTKGCCETGDDEKIKLKTIDQNINDYPYEAHVHIEGMHCQNCVKRIEAAYNEKGCLAEVSLRHKEAVVHSKEKMSEEMLTAIPARIGYDASVIQSS